MRRSGYKDHHWLQEVSVGKGETFTAVTDYVNLDAWIAESDDATPECEGYRKVCYCGFTIQEGYACIRVHLSYGSSDTFGDGISKGHFGHIKTAMVCVNLWKGATNEMSSEAEHSFG